MNNEPNLEGAKPLLQLVANDEFVKLEMTDLAEAFFHLYGTMCDTMTQASLCIMLAVERMRMEQPEIYQGYMKFIHQKYIEAKTFVDQN